MPSIFSPKREKGKPPAPISTRSMFKKGLPPAPGSLPTSPHRAQRQTQASLSEFGAIPHQKAFTLGASYRPPTPPTSPPPFSDAPLVPPKYTFLPTKTSSVTSSDNSIDSFGYGSDEGTSIRKYGLLGAVGSSVVLSLEDVGALLRDVGKHLENRGLATPLLFSNQALDMNPTRTKMLVESYIATKSHLSRGSQARGSDFLQDIEFAKEHELAWLLRWALSRITKQREGTGELYHGIMEWETYEEWRGRERSSGYPADAFPLLSSLVPDTCYTAVLFPLFRLLTRFASHSHLSGLTPHALSSLFAPLIFDVPSSAPAMSAHSTFVRAAAATEHLILAFIRSSGGATTKGGLGVADLPARLKEWVRGYPAMVASDNDLARAGPRRGARVIRCERASRQVRAYSRDLVCQAELWAEDLPVKWEAWERVILKSRQGSAARPKFSSDYRRKIGVKEMLPLPASVNELGRHTSYGRASRPGTVKGKLDRKSLNDEGDEARWGSLAGKEWSLFEESGFDAPLLATQGLRDGDIKSKLQFDLSESAKTSLRTRRDTMDWTEFASAAGGFNRTDKLLQVSLAFSQPISSSITDWPKERDELRKKLQKTQKEATPFHHDTTPKVGSEVAQDPQARADSSGRVYIEEAFLDCWADLMMGAGWMDRNELTFKEANWAFVEYKARPSKQEGVTLDPREDPRSTDLYFLFEERVPLEYQIAVADPKQKRTFATLFTPKSKKRVTASHSSLPIGGADNDFDRFLSRGQTRKLTLTSPESQTKATVWQLHAGQPASPTKTPTSQKTPRPSRQRTRSHDKKAHDPVEDAKIHEGKANFFSNKVIRRVKTDEDSRETAKRHRQREMEVDYELHSASGISSGDNSPNDLRATRRDEDKWMDILIANGARRMDRQEAPAPRLKHATPRGLPVSPHPPQETRSPQTRGEATPPVVVTHNPYHTPESADEVELPLPPRPPRSSSRPSLVSTPTSSRHGDSSAAHELSPTNPLSHTGLPTGPRSPPTVDLYGSETSSPTHQDMEILSPRPRRSPRGQRDTIRDIVDHYDTDLRESSYSAYAPDPRASHASYSSVRDSEITFEPVSEAAYEEEIEGTPTEEDHRIEPPLPLPSSPHPGDPSQVSTVSAEVMQHLKAPERIFDLTPGREPSPARYKHGEPLHFVGEEEEEE